MNLYLPKRINVGFQKRTGTYTGQLAYVIYFDDKGVLRKKSSWESWRDKSITPQEFDNVPTEGFVLNKKVGGYKSDWNFRQAYVRIYDPRGFEFEITVENLLFILENNDCIKGKGLSGEFVYSWHGKDLVLLPVNTVNYENSIKFSSLQTGKVSTKNLEVGASYITKKNHVYKYLGRVNKKFAFIYDEQYLVTSGISSLAAKLDIPVDDDDKLHTLTKKIIALGSGSKYNYPKINEIGSILQPNHQIIFDNKQKIIFLSTCDSYYGLDNYNVYGYLKYDEEIQEVLFYYSHYFSYRSAGYSWHRYNGYTPVNAISVGNIHISNKSTIIPSDNCSVLTDRKLIANKKLCFKSYKFKNSDLLTEYTELDIKEHLL